MMSTTQAVDDMDPVTAHEIRAEPIVVMYLGDDGDFVESLLSVIPRRAPGLEIHPTEDPETLPDTYSDSEIDCVLIDQGSAGTAGLSLLKDIRQTNPGIPVIFLTSFDDEGMIRAGIRHGVTDFVQKRTIPEQAPLLANRIEDAVFRYRRGLFSEQLNRIYRVSSEITRHLVHANSLSEIDDAVCQILSEADPYVFAWIGEHDPESDIVEPRAYGGVEEGYLNEITVKTDETPRADGPTGRAVRDREIAIMQDIPNDPQYEPWREQAMARGYRSSAAIPLIHDGNLYGVLNLYADRVRAFSEPELKLLDRLGETISAAMHRVSLQEELHRTKQAVENAADAIYITDRDGTIEYVNPAFESLTGYDLAEVRKETARILKSDETSEQDYASMWETILSGEVWHGEIVNQRKSGKLYDAAQTVAPITDDDDEISGFVAVQRDITDRKRRERQIERQQNRLRVLFDGAPDGIVVHDASGTILDVNDTLAKMLDYSRNELLSMDVHDFEVGIDPEQLRERWESMDIGPMQRITVDGTHRRKDGSTYPVEVWVSRIEFKSPESDRFIALARDISDRKERQQRLELFEQAVEEAGHAVVITDQDGTIEYVNPTFETMTGFTKSEAVGRTPQIVKSGKHPDEFYTDLWNTILDGDIWSAQLINRAADGSLFHVDQTIAPVTDSDDAITHFVGIESEITERRLREQRLDVLMRVLRHNVRNSMTSILGYLEVIDDHEPTDRLRTPTEVIRSEGQRLVELSEKALTMQQIFDPLEGEETRTIDLETCVTETITEIESAYPAASITVELENHGQIPVDPRLTYGIWEAIENAILHTDQQSPTVHVSAEASDPMDADLTDLVVADTGPGIPEDQRRVIEEERETQLTHGTGIGLWVMQWSVACFGGEIGFEANAPRGTRVIFRLPHQLGNDM